MPARRKRSPSSESSSYSSSESSSQSKKGKKTKKTSEKKTDVKAKTNDKVKGDERANADKQASKKDKDSDRKGSRDRDRRRDRSRSRDRRRRRDDSKGHPAMSAPSEMQAGGHYPPMAYGMPGSYPVPPPMHHYAHGGWPAPAPYGAPGPYPLRPPPGDFGQTSRALSRDEPSRGGRDRRDFGSFNGREVRDRDRGARWVPGHGKNPDLEAEKLTGRPLARNYSEHDDRRGGDSSAPARRGSSPSGKWKNDMFEQLTKS
eukprot:TRINITY_DN36285_c0_g1_i1.p1 TRINITY_DN36285_c0_g1~~TRINITY_DN36285_c0_g1_i1.p1  ORF type:complete len:259 (+),score=31.59 TRINITY_DN36285_c0_g1_i1:74-850(+)